MEARFYRARRKTKADLKISVDHRQPSHGSHRRPGLGGQPPASRPHRPPNLPLHPAPSPPPANFRESPQTQSPQPLPAHAAPEPESPTSEAGSRKPEAGFPLLYNQPEPTSRPTRSARTPPAPPRSARNVSAARSATISSPEGASPRKAPVVRPGKPQPRASETVEQGPVWPCDFLVCRPGTTVTRADTAPDHDSVCRTIPTILARQRPIPPLAPLAP
jgi:hypothetical protein